MVTDRQTRRRQREIATELAKIGFCLPGSLVSQTRVCNTAGCHCHDDPAARHGPYRLWTRKVAGKTLTRTLTEAQYEHYQTWIDNARRLHQLVAELEQLSAVAMAQAEQWPEPNPPPPDQRRNNPAPITHNPVGNPRPKAGT